MSKTSTREDGPNRARPRGMPLGRTRWAIAGMILGVAGSSWVGVGHRWPRPAGAPAAESEGTIDGAVRKVSEGIEDASADVRGRFDRAQEASRNDALVAEVKARLRQDKSLDSRRIDVGVESRGVVVLKGQVPDDASKEIAVDLARDIRGVVRVEDSLAVTPRPRVFAAASDDDPSTSAQPRRRR